MCGIAGWYGRSRLDVPHFAIEAQCDAIRHRGPDDSGVVVDGNFGFGMRRLSILDVPGGHQPMCTPDGRFSIVFNGEIYNHLDVRHDLGDAGYTFTTHSDTETILAAYARWGNDAWHMLEGMFAVAIWDRLERRLVLARDPLGIKPLYLTEQNGGLAFASELKALRRLPEHHFDICDRAVHDYFSFGHVRKPRSIFRQVRTLDPGHFMIIPHKGETVTRAFWTPEPRVAPTLSVPEWTEEMRSVLVKTVGRHMQSDVPVGAFLSGGIDSSAVLAAMARNSQSRLKAFTVGYPGAAIDETDAARQIAQHLNCEHFVLPLELRAAIDVLPEVQRCYDEPFADMAAVPTWYASRMAADHVKVVLCGEGGDELFAGYKRHRNARNIERHRSKIDAIMPVLSLVDRLPAGTSARLSYLRQHARRLGEFIQLPDGYQQFFAATQISQRSVRKAIYTNDFWNKYEGEDSYGSLEAEYFSEAPKGQSALEHFLLADLTVNMPSAMLTRLDRASMASSVEARVPFLSHRLVEWALTVPSELKLRGNVGKFILREAIKPWLPPSILKRPKQGFQMPLAKWFRGDFGDFARTAWNDSGASQAGYLDPPAVEALFREHKLGIANHSKMLYALSVFGLWWQDQGFDSAQTTSNAA